MTDQPEKWERHDKRGYSWEPFKPGHTLSLRHGARSARVYEPLAQELAQHLLGERPDLAPYTFAVGVWAAATTRYLLLCAYAEEVGIIDSETNAPREGLLQWITKLESAAARHAVAIGLTPGSHAALIRDRADATKSTWSLEDALESMAKRTPAQPAELVAADDDTEAQP
ncbi:MAG: hypothetical protein ACXWP6_02995 [Ktedonobacterales bacterium]